MSAHPAFRWQDQAALRAFVQDIGFGALFVASEQGPRVAHIPIVWLDDQTLGFHLARNNPVARDLDGATALFAVQGPHGYVSPDWYGTGPDEVPTWNYVTAELEGVVSQMDRDALIDQIDALSQVQEARLAPKPEWTRAKADPVRIARMLDAVTGFRLAVTAWRGTRKLAQTKPVAPRLAVADALAARGNDALAALMRAPS
ncbi:FMN-binding negative transcriptional regulator [Sphingomonas hengshuiensis]|uniref:Negative transcriptional regulator n=1 Tax=Sphingomonas hengshuiensis TaxID=1609977 RepID=A0A7U5HVI1_9SPHN|nr:FMN-binding negative transcriptional regulator [Sphingomonas hengshuiensis]AJP70651.1 negative transcriptional regulator [Sphingomonas hengshuiensis]